MTALLVVLQSFLSALGTVSAQKVLEKRTVGNDWQTFLSRAFHMVILSAAFGFSAFAFPEISKVFSLRDGAWFILSVVMLYVTYPLRRTAYLNEKISTLQPFVSAKGALVILTSYFLISDQVSAVTLFCALAAVATVGIAGMKDFRFSFNRFSAMILLSGIIQAFQTVIVVRFVGMLGPAGFYVVESAAILILSFLLIVTRGEFSQVKTITVPYFKIQFFANSIALASSLLVLSFYRDIGVVVTSLVAFLSLAFLYALTYAIYKDVPTKKDIAVTLVVSIFIAAWTYFR